MDNDKITVENLTEELAVILHDELIAECIHTEDTLRFHFPNGQNFFVKVEQA